MFATRLPLNWLHPKAQVAVPLGHFAAFLALWGGILACLIVLIVAPLWWLGLPWPLLAGFLLLLGIVLSGALHEDGLADCCDGFWGGNTPEKRHAIMKDSAIGSYGILGLIFSVSLRWGGLALLDPIHGISTFVLMHTIPRGCIGLLWALLPLWNGDSLAKERPSLRQTLIGLAIGLTIGLFITDPFTLGTTAAVVGLAMLTFSALALRKLGGLNGDCLGAAEQIGQVTLILLLLLPTA